MRIKLSIIYSWFVRTITYFLPNHPVFMRFRGFLYSLMMKECGNDFQVAASVVLNSLAKMVVGSNVYIAHNTVIIGTNISIGNEVLIGPNCVIASGNHTFMNESFRYGPSMSKAISIKDGSWVGGNCSILGGSSLPKQSILAAGSVLTKEFSNPRMIYAGSPAKPIKEIQSTRP